MESGFSIGITTYKYRLDKFLTPLIHKIRQYRDDEIILAVNGEYKEPFDNLYRQKVLDLCAGYSDVFPFIYPNFRSLAKMWNTIIINASNKYVLVLNDDITIDSSDFFDKVLYEINRIQNHFTIGYSYSHFVIRKDVMTPMDWFDERFLGIGCEDHDARRRNIIRNNSQLSGITNHDDKDHPVSNQKIENGKYSQFNRTFLYKELPPEPQYVFENFYMENIDSL